MPFDPTAFAEAAKEVFGVANTLVDEAVDQKHEAGHKYRMQEWNEAQSIDDTNTRANKSWSAVVRLLSEAGASTRSVGANVSFPIDTLAKLFELASEGIRDKALLNRKK